MSHAVIREQNISSTFLIVFKALVVSLTRIRSPIISEGNRLCWTLGSQVRRVLCFEKGTLFPYCFILPWNKPCWDRLKGWDTTSHNVLLGNIGDGENSYQCICRQQTFCLCIFAINLYFLRWSPIPWPTSKLHKYNSASRQGLKASRQWKRAQEFSERRSKCPSLSTDFWFAQPKSAKLIPKWHLHWYHFNEFGLFENDWKGAHNQIDYRFQISFRLAEGIGLIRARPICSSVASSGYRNFGFHP